MSIFKYTASDIVNLINEHYKKTKQILSNTRYTI